MELKDHYNQNSSSVLTSLPVINPSKNTLKFMPNPNFSEEIVEELQNGF